MATLAQLVVKITADTAEFIGQLDLADKRLQRFGSRLDRTGQRLTRGGTMLTAGLTLPIVGLGVAATKAAIDFESSFAGIRKTMDLTEAEFQRLAQANRDLAKTIPVSVNELNRIGELAGQLGIRGVENVVKFERTIAQIAVTTDLTADQAALAFAQIANVMRLPQDQIDRLGAAVVGLGNNFATTESRIVDFTQRIAGAGRLAKLTIGDVTGIATAFASLGIESEAGGTAVQKVILAMLTASERGGRELEVFARTAGVTAQEFAQLFERDAGQAFVRFVEGLGEQGNAAIGTLEELGLTDQRLTRAFLAAAQASDVLSDAVGKGNEEFEKNSALVEEAAKRFGTTGSQMRLFFNRVQDVAITLGQALIPAVTKAMEVSQPFLDIVAGLADAFARAPAPVQFAVIAFGALLATVGPLLLALGAMASSVSAVIAVLPLLGTAASVAAGPVGLAALALALLLGIRLFGEFSQKAREATAAMEMQAEAGRIAAEKSREAILEELDALARKLGALSDVEKAALEIARADESQIAMAARGIDMTEQELRALLEKRERLSALSEALEILRDREAITAATAEDMRQAIEEAGLAAGPASGALDGLANTANMARAELAALNAEAIATAAAVNLIQAIEQGGEVPLTALEGVIAQVRSLLEQQKGVRDLVDTILEEADPTGALRGIEKAAGGGGAAGAAASAFDRAKAALQATQDRRTGELVEAFIRGGMPAVERLRGEFAAIDEAFDRIAPKLQELGVEVPEEFRAVFERIQRETKDARREVEGEVGGLLGFLIGRRLARGLDPGGGLIRVGGDAGTRIENRVEQVIVNTSATSPAGIAGDVADGVAEGMTRGSFAGA